MNSNRTITGPGTAGDERIIRLKTSIGEYVPGACATCKQKGCYHERLICRVCGWPPALDGRCLCDQPIVQKTGVIDA